MTRYLVRIISHGALIAALSVAASISGCGQKGPLFLPQDKLDEIERKRDERKEDKAPAKTSRLELHTPSITA